jgi:hypothetical protein
VLHVSKVGRGVTFSASEVGRGVPILAIQLGVTWAPYLVLSRSVLRLRLKGVKSMAGGRVCSTVWLEEACLARPKGLGGSCPARPTAHCAAPTVDPKQRASSKELFRPHGLCTISPTTDAGGQLMCLN